jgi:hypothetical protein
MGAMTGRGPDAGSAGPATTLDVVRRYHASWVGRDFATAAALPARDLRVEVPINDYPTRESFVEALTAFGGRATRVDLLDEFVHDTTPMVLYDMQVEGLGTFRVAEHFTVQDGLICRLRQIHDTYPIRVARGHAGG